MKSSYCSSLAVLALALLVTPSTSFDGVPCDMGKLQPVLDSADMKNCRAVAYLEIPSTYFTSTASSLAKGDRAVCTEASCGRAVAAIKALKLSECLLGETVCNGPCRGSVTSLYRDYLNVVDAYCGGKLNDGKVEKTPTPTTTTTAPVTTTPPVTTQPVTTSPVTTEPVATPTTTEPSPETPTMSGSTDTDTDTDIEAVSTSASRDDSETIKEPSAPKPTAKTPTTTSAAHHQVFSLAAAAAATVTGVACLSG